MKSSNHFQKKRWGFVKYRMKWTEKNEKIGEIEWESSPIDREQIKEVIHYVEKKYHPKNLSIIDELGQVWRKKDFLKLFEKEKEKPYDIVVYFDGNYNKENKEAGLGIVVYYTQNEKRVRIRNNQLFFEIESNNEAEYAALYYSLKVVEAQLIQHTTVTFRGDSLVVINQMNGEWPVYEQNLIYWIEKIEQKINELRLSVTFETIPRHDNKEADKLATLALSHREIEAKRNV